MGADKAEVVCLRPRELVPVLRGCIENRTPVLIWGNPGIGKTQIVRQTVEGMERELRPFIASIHDPTDVSGIPMDVKPPSVLPEDQNSSAVVFLDELTQAPATMQAACMSLILERRAGRWPVPEGVAFVGACNYLGDRAGTHRMITPLGRRFLHLDLVVDVADWLAWGVAFGIAPQVRSYIAWQGLSALHDFDPSRNDRTFPCPGTWETVSKNFGVAVNNHREHAVFAGCVGVGRATDFIGFLEVYGKVPDPKIILGHPDQAPVPTEIPMLFALSSALVNAVGKDVNRAAACLRYSRRLLDEYAVALGQDLTRVVPAVLGTQEGRTWMEKYKVHLLQTA